jgi:cell filamentation protein
VSNDPYTDPTTGVLFNKLGIKDADRLAVAEANITAIRIAQLKEQPIVGRFDLSHLQDLHKHIFKDVYAWAGELRVVNITKQDSVFAFAQFLQPAATKLFETLAGERHLQELSVERFVERAAYYYSELNALHAFREGNGRTNRAFLEQLGKAAGHELDLSASAKDQVNEQSARAHLSGDYRHMVPLIESAVRSASQAQRDLTR